MRLPVLTIRDVAERQLCCGCGACAYISPDDIRMVDDVANGRRPLTRNDDSPTAREAMAVCPGVRLAHDPARFPADSIAELIPGWGPILEVWEGHATDEQIRYAGSSGGAASALAMFCIEQGEMHGLLHIDARPDAPILNHTVLSTSREQILRATGSRYAPASPCDGLGMVEAAPGPCVMIGKPCDIAAAQKAGELRPSLGERLGLTIAIFCAGTPSTQGTMEMLRALGVDDPRQVESVRYRGNGWPGNATVTWRDRSGASRESSLTYAQSWGEILQKHRQWRCYICPDHTGEFADISVGDPWYRPIPEGAMGHSLVLVRSERGRDIVRRAMAAGYLTLERVESRIVPASQPNLLSTRGALWGRRVALRLMGAPVPEFRNMPMFRFWLSELSLKQKAQSIYGTIRRVFRKGLRERRPVTPLATPDESTGAFESTGCLSPVRAGEEAA